MGYWRFLRRFSENFGRHPARWGAESYRTKERMAAGFGSESGRSLVEMLGTLAIMGILTIGGIAGFNYAMNKQRANATVNYVNQLAVLGTGQMLAGGTPKLLDYPNHTPSGYPANITTEDGKDNLFYIEIDEVPTAVCEELFSRQSGWKMVNDIGFISVGEENIGACSDKEKVGMWFEIKATADKDPEPPFHCTTDQDCYNEKGANYVCKLPRGVCELSCPAGQIFTGGSCQSLRCERKTSAYFTCYLNDKRCATTCRTSDPTDASTCWGVCDPSYCSGYGEWKQITMRRTGFGCLDKESGLYCSTFQQHGWYCANFDYPTEECCNGKTFASCDKGICNKQLCANVGGTFHGYVSGYGYCKVTKNNYTAYCTVWDRQWMCNYVSTVGFSADQTRSSFCGLCSEYDLDNGDCGNCFNGVRNCNWGTYDSTLNRCVGELNGTTITCDFSDNCYINNSRCGGCSGGDPRNCFYGVCDKSICPADAEFVKGSNYYACQFTRGNYVFSGRAWSGVPYGCYVKPATGGSGQEICGTYCNTDCTGCRYYSHQACAPAGKCLTNGAAMDTDGDGVADCECPGQASYGHCCEAGHTYINGACNLYSCGANQCVSASGICQNLGSQWIRDENGNCKAK